MDAFLHTIFSKAFPGWKCLNSDKKNSLKFIPKGPINNIPALVPIMAWRRPSDEPLSEPMMVSLSTHISFIRPQWVNLLICFTWICVKLIEAEWRIYASVIQPSLVQIMACRRRQAIIWTNAGILIGPLGTNFSEILIGNLTFSFKKMCLKVSSVKWCPFCLGLNVLSVDDVLFKEC